MAQLFRPSANNIAKASVLFGAAAPLVIGYVIAAFSRSPFNTKVMVAKDQPVPFSHQHHAWELGIDCRYCHTGVEKSAFAGLPQTEICMSCHSQIWTNSPLLEPVRKSYETGAPIKWTLVNKTPEFVYFNHSIHVNRGINCDTCHGPIQSMPITAKGNAFQMIWCLQCHREPEKYLMRDASRPDLTQDEQVFNLYRKLQSRDPLSPREVSVLTGGGPKSDQPADIDEGVKLIHDLGVKKAQLADCSVCHR